MPLSNTATPTLPRLGVPSLSPEAIDLCISQRSSNMTAPSLLLPIEEYRIVMRLRAKNNVR